MKQINILVGTLVLLGGAVSPAKAEPTIPNSIVQSNLKGYSDAEKRLIQEDLKNIRTMSFFDIKKTKALTYYASAGAPGAAKSTVLENFLEKNNIKAVYIDPDRVSLRSMINTYVKHLSASNNSNAISYNALTQEAYLKLRGGSNYITGMILNDATSKKVNIAHGTTSTSGAIKNLYKNLKQKGYKIILLLCGSTDTERMANITHRRQSQGITQVTDEDIFSKGKLFTERFEDYFNHADQIYIYWTESIKEGSILAAIYSPKKGLDVKDQKALERFIQTHGPLPL